jgi:hypothetical protein
MAAAEPGNWQSHIKPLGVVPGWLFYFARPWGLSHATREDRPGFSALSSRYGRSAKLPRMRKADDGGDARSKDWSAGLFDLQVSGLHEIGKVRVRRLKRAEPVPAGGFFIAPRWALVEYRVVN